MNRSPFLIAICVVPWALAIAGLGWLLIHRFPPSGVTVIDVPFDGRSAWIYPFLPGDRVSAPGDQPDDWVGQRIFGDPVYAAARAPGVYEDVEVSMEFRPIRQPLIELGVVRNIDAGEIAFEPLWFEQIQDETWKPFEDGYRLDATNGDLSRVAIWRASSTMPLLSDPAGEMRTTRVTLRGSHDVFAVPAGGTLSFRFEIQDANRASGPDTVMFRIFRDAQEIGTEALGIGGTRDEGMGTVVSKTITLAEAIPGVYRIQLIADDDIFIRAITTNAKRWVLGPRLSFGDDVGFATSTQPGVAWTDSRHLVLQTFHNEGLQEVTIGSDRVRLTRTHDSFRLDRTDKAFVPQRLEAPRGDVRVIGDGWFAFQPDAWFAPQPRRVTDATVPSAEGVRTVITPYRRPEALGEGWYRTTVRLALGADQDVFRLALSSPGIESRNAAVDIRRVRLVYRRPALSWNEWWRLIIQEGKNAVRRWR